MSTENLDPLHKTAGATWEHDVFNVKYTVPGGGGINFDAQYGDWSRAVRACVSRTRAFRARTSSIRSASDGSDGAGAMIINFDSAAWPQ
jgi:hypothetical protein